MTLCIVCNGEGDATSKICLCQHCAGVLSTDGLALPASLAPEAMTEHILTELRERVARSVGDAAVERELTKAEVDDLMRDLPSDD